MIVFISFAIGITSGMRVGYYNTIGINMGMFILYRILNDV